MFRSNGQDFARVASTRGARDREEEVDRASRLRVIAHVDMDAMYAASLQVRFGVPPFCAVACQQWVGLIAVNYTAKLGEGISRMDTIHGALKKVKAKPLLGLHIETTTQTGRARLHRPLVDPKPKQEASKASLHQFRMFSIQLMRLFASIYGAASVQRGSVDEAWVDLQPLAHRFLSSLVIATTASTSHGESDHSAALDRFSTYVATQQQPAAAPIQRFEPPALFTEDPESGATEPSMACDYSGNTGDALSADIAQGRGDAAELESQRCGSFREMARAELPTSLPALPRLAVDTTRPQQAARPVLPVPPPFALPGYDARMRAMRGKVEATATASTTAFHEPSGRNCTALDLALQGVELSFPQPAAASSSSCTSTSKATITSTNGSLIPLWRPSLSLSAQQHVAIRQCAYGSEAAAIILDRVPLMITGGSEEIRWLKRAAAAGANHHDATGQRSCIVATSPSQPLRRASSSPAPSPSLSPPPSSSPCSNYTMLALEDVTAVFEPSAGGVFIGARLQSNGEAKKADATAGDAGGGGPTRFYYFPHGSVMASLAHKAKRRWGATSKLIEASPTLSPPPHHPDESAANYTNAALLDEFIGPGRVQLLTRGLVQGSSCSSAAVTPPWSLSCCLLNRKLLVPSAPEEEGDGPQTNISDVGGRGGTGVEGSDELRRVHASWPFPREVIAKARASLLASGRAEEASGVNAADVADDSSDSDDAEAPSIKQRASSSSSSSASSSASSSSSSSSAVGGRPSMPWERLCCHIARHRMDLVLTLQEELVLHCPEWRVMGKDGKAIPPPDLRPPRVHFNARGSSSVDDDTSEGGDPVFECKYYPPVLMFALIQAAAAAGANTATSPAADASPASFYYTPADELHNWREVVSYWLAVMDVLPVTNPSTVSSLAALMVQKYGQWRVRQVLGVTCSWGLAPNMIISKLGSAMHKPSMVTLLSPLSIVPLLSRTPLKKLRGLGGDGGLVCALYVWDKIRKAYAAQQQQLQSNKAEVDPSKRIRLLEDGKDELSPDTADFPLASVASNAVISAIWKDPNARNANPAAKPAQKAGAMAADPSKQHLQPSSIVADPIVGADDGLSDSEDDDDIDDEARQPATSASSSSESAPSSSTAQTPASSQPKTVAPFNPLIVRINTSSGPNAPVITVGHVRHWLEASDYKAIWDARAGIKFNAAYYMALLREGRHDGDIDSNAAPKSAGAHKQFEPATAASLEALRERYIFPLACELSARLEEEGFDLGRRAASINFGVSFYIPGTAIRLTGSSSSSSSSSANPSSWAHRHVPQHRSQILIGKKDDVIGFKALEPKLPKPKPVAVVAADAVAAPEAKRRKLEVPEADESSSAGDAVEGQSPGLDEVDDDDGDADVDEDEEARALKAHLDAKEAWSTRLRDLIVERAVGAIKRDFLENDKMLERELAKGQLGDLPAAGAGAGNYVYRVIDIMADNPKAAGTRKLMGFNASSSSNDGLAAYNRYIASGDWSAWPKPDQATGGKGSGSATVGASAGGAAIASTRPLTPLFAICGISFTAAGMEPLASASGGAGGASSSSAASSGGIESFFAAAANAASSTDTASSTASASSNGEAAGSGAARKSNPSVTRGKKGNGTGDIGKMMASIAAFNAAAAAASPGVSVVEMDSPGAGDLSSSSGAGIKKSLSSSSSSATGSAKPGTLTAMFAAAAENNRSHLPMPSAGGTGSRVVGAKKPSAGGIKAFFAAKDNKNALSRAHSSSSADSGDVVILDDDNDDEVEQGLANESEQEGDDVVEIE